MACSPPLVKMLTYGQKRAFKVKSDIQKENKDGKTALELAWLYDAKDGGAIIGYLIPYATSKERVNSASARIAAGGL